MRIAFTHNLKTSDDEAQAEFDTAATVQQIAEALQARGHEVYPVDVGGPVGRLIARLETLGPDLIFNTAEGSHGRFREAFYPALFEHLGIPCTGSGAHACALTLDKRATKMIVASVGVPTPRWSLFDEANAYDPETFGLRYPVILKPNFEGSSKGVTAESIVHDQETLEVRLPAMLARYPLGILVEEFIIGRDVTVPFLELGGVLEPAAYRFDVPGGAEGFAIYDYALKNHDDALVHLELPAPITDTQRLLLMDYTARAMRALEVRDLGRADFRVTPDGFVYFIEVNALPSLESGASMYLSAAHAGIGDEGVVLDRVIQSAAQRQGIEARAPRAKESLRVGLAHNVRRVDPRSGQDADAEFDAPATIEAIASAIQRLGHEVVLLEATPALPHLVSERSLDLVFNIAEGLRGRSREAQVPALLDLLDIPYTGSDAAAMAVTLDKGLAKRLVREAGLPTPAWEVVPPGKAPTGALRFPVIVKPNAEGSSKGISTASVARDRDALAASVAALHARYGSSVLVEEFLTGREFTVGLLGDESPRVLPVMEIVFHAPHDALPVYSYEHKTDEDASVTFEVPACVDSALEAALRETALGCFEALGCRDVGRVDLRLDADGVPHFIECNPLPGLSPGFSDLCVIAEAAGMDHANLIAAIMAPAVRRLNRQLLGGDV